MAPAAGGAGRECSASRLMLEIGEQDLPDAVARMRQQLVVSALMCDFEKLGRLAAGEFSRSLGAVESGPSAYWRNLERTGQQEALANLVRVLSLPPGVLEVEDGDVESIYVWPAAAAADEPTEEDWKGLTDAFDPGLIERIRRDSERMGLGYLGWRVGISSRGDWIYYQVP